VVTKTRDRSAVKNCRNALGNACCGVPETTGHSTCNGTALGPDENEAFYGFAQLRRVELREQGVATSASFPRKRESGNWTFLLPSSAEEGRRRLGQRQGGEIVG